MTNPFPANFEGLDGSRRLTGQVNFTDPANQPGGGGGGVTPVSAYVRLSADATVAAAATIPWDTVEFDSAGYFDAVGHRFVIPAGQTGRHLVGVQLEAISVAAPRMSVTVENGGADANLVSGVVNTTAATSWAACPSLLITCAVGDTLSVDLGFDVDATVTVNGGANGSVFWLVYLGTG